MDSLISKLMNRMIKAQRPFIRKLSPETVIESILSDGLFSVFLQSWLRFFPKKNFLILDGNTLNTDPAKPIIDAEDFLGLTQDVNHSRKF